MSIRKYYFHHGFIPFTEFFCYTTGSMFKKLLVASVFFFCAALLVHAEDPPASNYDLDTDPWGYKITQTEFTQYRSAVENCDTPSLECLVRNTTRFIAMEWSQDIVGSNKINNLDCTLPENAEFCKQASARSGGLTASVFSFIGSMISKPPAHTATYVADVLNTAGVATPAYAQGVGFASLDPILGLWKVFRNVAYFFFIVVFIILGFMIMFQQRLGSKAAITAQQAIPTVIVSLLLVTFSYAIAGFIIDLMYLFMFLIVGLFKGIQASFSVGNIRDPVSFTWLDLFGFLFSSSWSWQANGLNTDIVSSVLNAAGSQSQAMNTVMSILGGMTLTLVITLAVLIGSVRLLFELLKSYVVVILSIVTSPLILMVGAFPGKDVFWPWLKGIIGNLMAFPTVLLLLIIYIEFTTGTIAGAVGASDQGGFMPPFLFGSGAGNVNMIGPILGLAMILAMPEIVKEVKKICGAGDGGFAAFLATAAWKNFKTAPRYAPLATGAAGYAGGLAEGAVRAGANGDFGRGTLKVAGRKIFGYAGVRAKQGSSMGKSVASGFEQMTENKWIDPNAWENVILQEGRDRRKTQLQARIDELKNIGTTPGGPAV